MLGTPRFLAVFLGSGLLANLATYMFDISPLSLGASGCICGLIGAYAAYGLKNRKQYKENYGQCKED